jgi:hypothetical protein
MYDSLKTVAEIRNYQVINTQQAKEISAEWLVRINLNNIVTFGLPEIDDRYHIWRVPLLNKLNQERLGELVIDAKTSLIIEDKSTNITTLEAKLLGRNDNLSISKQKNNKKTYSLSRLRNTIALGDCEQILQDLPSESIDLVFTSPPYYNARPEYVDYISYEDYLLKIRKVIHNVHRVLAEGRFFCN